MEKKTLLKDGFSDVSIDSMPVVDTDIDDCVVCERILDDNDKMVIFEATGVPRSYYCRFCHSVYGDGDILIFANTSKINNVVGLS